MDEAERAKLWKEYAAKHAPEVREKLIIEYAPLVKLVAGRLSMYLGFNVEYDDLVGYGVFGLIDAIDKFDAMKDVGIKHELCFSSSGYILEWDIGETGSEHGAGFMWLQRFFELGVGSD